MTTVYTRAAKGSALTWTEGDANITNLNNDKIEAVVDDTTPQLGGNLDVNGNSIVSAANGDISITPNGTGSVIIDGNEFPQTQGAAGEVLTADGSGLVEWKLNQTLSVQVYNADSVTINKGEPVYVFSSTGTNISVKRALNTSDATSAQTLGLANENISAGATGIVICQGLLKNVDTSAYTAGDGLYLGATAGSKTTTKPYAPNHIVYLGFVETVNASSGRIYVRTQNGYELDEIHDADIGHTQALAANQYLRYTGSLWQNSALDISHDTTPQLGGNLDVNGNAIVSVSNGNIRIEPNGTGDIQLTPATGDVIIDGTTWPADAPSNGEVLTADGTGGSYWSTPSGGLANVVEDTTPQLGGNLDVNGNSIVSTSNGNITLAPNGSGKVIINGTLQVDGTTTTINSTVTTVDDPVITLGGDTAPSSDDNKDRGIEFRWHNGSTAKLGFFGYDDSTGYLTFIPDATNTSEVFSGTLGDIQAANFRGALIGNADTSTYAGAVTLTADNSTNATNYPLFVNAATGNLSPRTDTGFTYNPSTNTLTAGVFSGSGASLTSIPNGALTNSSITFGSTATSLGGTVSALNNVTVGQSTAAAGTFTNLSSTGTFTFKNPIEAIYDLGTTGGTVAPDPANGSVQKITLNSALTINAFTNPTAGESLTLIIYGGTAYTSITSTMKFAGGVKTLTGTASCIDILSIYYDGTTYFASLNKGFA